MSVTPESAVAPARIVVLISGRGRNLQSLIEACARGHINGRICAVISNRAEVEGLARAEAAGIPALVVPSRGVADRETYDAELAHQLDVLAPDIIVLAGFMRILTPGFVRRYRGRMLNIHPSLLPKYPGLHTHQRALEAGDAEHGATVHFVTEELDGGPPIVQGKFMVREDDTPETLADRVMQLVELKIYPQAVAWLARGAVALSGDVAEYEGRPLTQPKQLDALEPAFR